MPNSRIAPVQKIKTVQSFIPLFIQREYSYVYKAKIIWVPLRDQFDFIRSLQNVTTVPRLALGWFLKGFYVKT